MIIINLSIENVWHSKANEKVRLKLWVSYLLDRLQMDSYWKITDIDGSDIIYLTNDKSELSYLKMKMYDFKFLSSQVTKLIREISKYDGK